MSINLVSGTTYTISFNATDLSGNPAATVSDTNINYTDQPLLCWNYRANYKGSNRMFTANGGGKFPSELLVPSSVDVSSGIMVDEGKFIEPTLYKIIQ